MKARVSGDVGISGTTVTTGTAAEPRILRSAQFCYSAMDQPRRNGFADTTAAPMTWSTDCSGPARSA